MNSHEKYKILMMKYLEGEITKNEKFDFEEHIKACKECQEEIEEFRNLKEVMEDMKYKKPPDEIWKTYWTRVYNRIERGLGWIFTSIGAIILLTYGGFKGVEGLIKDPGVAIIAKIGILAGIAGLAILFVSVLRERIFISKT
ncbi:zf-HC2 domain-containing protein, partial [candidate division WOR-3 bacterium]|nr:zf-HC2 domain-containing protein [candidate division WOR-3 bacterium]